MAVTIRQLLELFFPDSCPDALVRVLGEHSSPLLLFSGHPSDPDLLAYLDMPVRRCFWSHAGVLDVDLMEGGDV